MPFVDEAYMVLREKRQWMHVVELIQEVLDQGRFTSNAKDPIQSLRGTLHSAVTRSSNRRGFVCQGPYFGLEEWGPEIPPPDDAGRPRRRTQRSPAAATLPLTEEQLLAIQGTMPADQFEKLFGDLWQRYQEQRRRRLITPVSDRQLLQKVRREVDKIQDFLLGESKQVPGPELIANRIVFCYRLGLYREGAALLEHIGPDQIGEALYEHVRKIAQACEVHLR